MAETKGPVASLHRCNIQERYRDSRFQPYRRISAIDYIGRCQMRFLLHQGLGYLTIHRIGDCLRAHGSGHHWIEKYRGDIFVNVSDDRDDAILREQFADLLDPVTPRHHLSGAPGRKVR